MSTEPGQFVHNEHLYAQTFYPSTPLSWLAPFLSLICGVAASANWEPTLHDLLQLASLLLLVGPLLGTAWATGIRTRWRDSNGARSQDDGLSPLPWQDLALPYTRPGSASHRLARQASAAAGQWKALQPHIGRPLLLLLASSFFALAMATQLGPQCLGIVLMSIFIVFLLGIQERHDTLAQLLGIVVPIWSAWLVGHSAFGPVHLRSVWTSGCFAVSYSGFWLLERSRRPMTNRLLVQAAAQAGILTGLVLIRQPLVSAAVALLATPQLLLLPLLEARPDATESGQVHLLNRRRSYFRSLQLPLIAGMILTAAALGYGT